MDEDAYLSRIKSLETIFSLRLPICFKYCNVNQRNPYSRLCTGRLHCYESADLRLLAGSPWISNLSNDSAIILAIFQILFYLQLGNEDTVFQIHGLA